MLSGLPLDRDAIRAVLDAAGAPPAALPPLPADLTERELEVLRQLVVGRTKREIAGELVISPSTVHTHTVHIRLRHDTTTASAEADIAVVRSGFDAFARGDLAAFAAMFHPDETWSHRNYDRLGGVHQGIEGILAFLKESGQLTARSARCRARTWPTATVSSP